MNFSEKTAVVTGGSRGLGRAICLELARGGANVVLCYAGNEAAANETVAACKSLGATAVAIRCDVSKEDEVKALMDAALKTFGRIDILVNNAGITKDGLLMRRRGGICGFCSRRISTPSSPPTSGVPSSA